MSEARTLHELVADMAVLYELALEIGQTLDVAANCQRFLGRLMARKNFDACTLWVRTSRLREGRSGRRGAHEPYVCLYTFPAPAGDGPGPLAPDHDLVKALATRPLLSVAEPDPLYRRLRAEDGHLQGSYLLVAFADWGVLKLHSSVRERVLDRIELAQLDKLMARFARSLEGGFSYAALREEIGSRRQTEAQLFFLAHHDPLTGLPNRTTAMERLDRIQRHGDGPGAAAILYIDLDRFKNINDSLGHLVGDRLLTEVARRLRGCVRSTDLVSRLGGDEFLVVLDGVRETAAIERIAGQIIEACRRPFLIDGRELYIGCSIGITVFPDDAGDGQRLISHADSALYQAKRAGGNCHRFFTPELDADVSHRLRVESALHGALTRHQMRLVYQPIVDLADGRVRGFESLLRWQHPKLGTVSPEVFIPIAEENGLIKALGEWCLVESVAMLAELRRRDPRLFVAVNVSERQLQGDTFPALVDRLLEEGALPAEALHLELTERVLIGEHPETLRTIQRLAAMGIDFSIDDFGTGYSALSYLRRFPCGTIKIDRAFVKDIEQDAQDAALVEAIVRMGQSLSRRIIAEGVETPEQLDHLRAVGCDMAQGYLFSAPLEADALLPWLETYTPRLPQARPAGTQQAAGRPVR
ncbi:MAG: EAL domain-containing protein [Gammaproteobacteria bacterium]|nr:MAG: EAL domain-containing protein [Gammaproteobacteria bacterium]